MSDPGGKAPGWVADAVFYQVFPDRFARSGRVAAPGPLEPWDAPPTVHGFKGGDLHGVIDHLDHLEDLGVTAVYLNPIFSSASNHRYHTFDYRSVDPLLGGDAALRALLDATHRRGMRVILDGVFNHASRGFWPFHHVLETGRHSPYRDWFHLSQVDLDAGRPLRAYPTESLAGALSADWGERHGAGSESLTTLGYRAWWDLPALPKLNTDNPLAREYLMGVAEHWTGFGIDGWRLDVPGEITTPGFWEEFRQRVRAINPEAYLVAEIWQERPDLLDGRTFDGLMNYPLATAILSFVTGDHLDRRVLAQQQELDRQVRPTDGAEFLAALQGLVDRYSPAGARAMLGLIGSHDMPRFLSLAGCDVASLRLAWLVLLTAPGPPCLYYGDEIGMRGEHDPDNRGAFPWDHDAWDTDLLATVRALVRGRRATPALRSGSLVPLAADGMAAAYRRGDETPTGVVAINAGERAAILEGIAGPGDHRLAPLPVPGLGGGTAEVDGGRLRLVLPPRSGLVLREG